MEEASKAAAALINSVTIGCPAQLDSVGADFVVCGTWNSARFRANPVNLAKDCSYYILCEVFDPATMSATGISKRARPEEADKWRCRHSFTQASTTPVDDRQYLIVARLFHRNKSAPADDLLAVETCLVRFSSVVTGVFCSSGCQDD